MKIVNKIEQRKGDGYLKNLRKKIAAFFFIFIFILLRIRVIFELFRSCTHQYFNSKIHTQSGLEHRFVMLLTFCVSDCENCAPFLFHKTHSRLVIGP